MANTTFSGPVRSQNGFQEWDGSAWVPVGGGGGNVTQILTPFGSDGEVIVLLTGITQTTPGEVGQTFEVVVEPTIVPAGSSNLLTISPEVYFATATFTGGVIKILEGAISDAFAVTGPNVQLSLANSSGSQKLICGRVVITVTNILNIGGTDYPTYTVSGQISLLALGG